MKTFEDYLLDLYLVLTHNSYIARLEFAARAEHTALGLADLIVHGSINRAVNEYGVARQTEGNPVPWYYACRDKTFESEPGASEQPTPTTRSG